jgi:hypothetical protein
MFAGTEVCLPLINWIPKTCPPVSVLIQFRENIEIHEPQSQKLNAERIVLICASRRVPLERHTEATIQQSLQW